MLQFSINPKKILKHQNKFIHSFLVEHEDNIDWDTVKSFGTEWTKFRKFNEAEIEKIGNDYFDLTHDQIINPNTIALDVGCGTGRWAHFLSDKVKFIEAIDPSVAVFSAVELLDHKKNVRVSQASVNNIPFTDKTFDFVYSLGVLHHLPDTQQAIGHCVRKLKPGGWLLLYLYYNLDNRGFLYKGIFKISSFLRRIISKMPSYLKHFLCDVIAATIYLPLALLSNLLYAIPFLKRFAELVPLSYYRKTSFYIMRNDALDRFGTPLEKRFSREEIEGMLVSNNLTNIKFSNSAPYWHVIAQHPK